MSGESEIIQFNQDKLGAFGITECRLSLWVCRLEFQCIFIVIVVCGPPGTV